MNWKRVTPRAAGEGVHSSAAPVEVLKVR